MLNVTEPVGLDRAELKRLLRSSRDEPVSAAFALDADGKALIQLHRTKPPRALERALKDTAPDSKTHRFGTALIDPGDDKHVRFVVNKAGGGLARKLTAALKGTGFNRVSIELEDGSAVEQHTGEEDRGEAEVPDVPSAAPTADLGASSRAGQATPDTPGPDALRGDLAGLVQRMLAAIARDPSQKATLVELATDAQASLKRGDAARASASIDLLRQLLGTAPPPGDTPNEATGAEVPRPDPATAMKARQVWHGTLQKLEAELAKLRAGIKDHYGGHPGLADIEAMTAGSLGAILEELDTTLADHFDRYANAAPAEQADIAAAIRTTLAGHRAFVAHNPLLQEIDDNPFVAVSVRKPLEAALSTLSRSIG